MKKGFKKSEILGANFHVCKSYRGKTGRMGLEISYTKKLRKEGPNSHMTLCVVAATQRITESQKNTVMLEELFSDYTGLTSLTGKPVKS